MKKRKGFTLIEVLIVVAIIGILASVVLIGLGPLQRRGRDSRRISDLRQVQNGLEIYYNKCGYYPGGAENGVSCGIRAAGNPDWAGLVAALTQSGIGISNVPSDPAAGAGRNCMYATEGGNGLNYILAATLDDASNPALQGDVDGNVFGIDCADPNYCVQL